LYHYFVLCPLLISLYLLHCSPGGEHSLHLPASTNIHTHTHTQIPILSLYNSLTIHTIYAQVLTRPCHLFIDTHLQHITSSQFDLRNATSFTGIPLFSDQGQAWIESRTDSRMTPQTLCAFGRQWHNPRRLYQDADAATSTQPCELPPRPTVERYAAMYSSSFECLVFPILSKCLFVKTLDLAYQSRDSPSAASARSCVYSFLAMISILRFEQDPSAAMASESYAAAAASFIPQVTQEMTGDGLQMLVTLVSLCAPLHTPCCSLFAIYGLFLLFWCCPPLYRKLPSFVSSKFTKRCYALCLTFDCLSTGPSLLLHGGPPLDGPLHFHRRTSHLCPERSVMPPRDGHVIFFSTTILVLESVAITITLASL
jgi:hypothetical protein